MLSTVQKADLESQAHKYLWFSRSDPPGSPLRQAESPLAQCYPRCHLIGLRCERA